MPFLTQSMNQFAQDPILGLVSMIPSPNVVSAIINRASVATTIQVGDAVKLIDDVSGAITVDRCSGPTDGPVFGVIVYNARKNLYSPGDLIEVAGPASYVYLKTSAAVARGAKVTTTASTSSEDARVATVSAPATQYVTGIAADKASGANALIRVIVTPSLNSGV